MHGKGEAPAIRILEEAGEDVGRLEYRFVERGGTKDAARQLGLCEHDIVKSLVFAEFAGKRRTADRIQTRRDLPVRAPFAASGVRADIPFQSRDVVHQCGRTRRHRRHPARGPAAFRGRSRRHSEWRIPAIALDDVYGERLFGVRYIRYGVHNRTSPTNYGERCNSLINRHTANRSSTSSASASVTENSAAGIGSARRA